MKRRLLQNLNPNLKSVRYLTPSKYILILVSVLLFTTCCEEKVEPEPELKITGVSIPSSINVSPGEEVTLTGKGFMIGDQIRLESTNDSNITFTITISSVTDQSVSFFIPDGFSSGYYSITVVRGDDSQLLGSVFFNLTANTNIPDIEGMTIKGVVYCNGVGIEGVVVSDGYEVTETDENGVYYLPSDKELGYVFISLPGNYEVVNIENMPQFYKWLSGGSTVEQKDFSLVEAENTNHVLLAMADWHLANRNDDLNQFSSGFLVDVNNTIDEYESQGIKVYGLTLGDMTWDLYWYSNNFAIPEYLNYMYDVNCPIFNTMGNHDNDPYYAEDWLASEAFRNGIGPTYYSFNLGNIHYVVLDNIEYLNYGASQGVIGDRNYNNKITADQMTWLERDLATLNDPNTPVIVAMHSPLYQKPVVDAAGNYTPSFSLDNGSSLASQLASFTNVHVLSGHTHVNYSVETSGSIMEHNTAAVSATWWWTGKPGYANNHICKDGSPGGYGVWEINGSDLEWYYKSCGYEKNYQFRSYDLNTILITAENFAPNSTDEALADYVSVYGSQSNANEVLINVWGYDKSWSVVVKEGGSQLEVTQVNMKDPLHIISYEALRLNVGAVPTSGFVTGVTNHLFKAKASSPTSTLDIIVTDRFGNEYTETMERPKAFTYDMR